MSFSFGKSKSSQSTTESQTKNPWAPTIAPLKGLISQVDSLRKSNTGPTQGQTAAYGELKDVVAQGNPYAGQIGSLANDLFGTQSRAGDVTGAYDDLKRRLTPTADGQNLNLEQNPYIQRLLQQTTDDAVNRSRAYFAGAGRSFSDVDMTGAVKAASDAQLPTLSNLYQQEQARTDQAARDLYTYGSGAATTAANLDASAAEMRGAGIDVGNAALDAKVWGPNKMLELEQQLKDLPISDLERIANILFPAAGLGGTSTGQSDTKGKSSSMELGLRLI